MSEKSDNKEYIKIIEDAKERSKMEDKQLVQLQPPPITTIQDKKYKKIYANSIQMNVSLWDFFLDFGTISQKGQDVTITTAVGVILSPQQAKALFNVLRENVKQYETAFGEIRVSPKDQVTQ